MKSCLGPDWRLCIQDEHAYVVRRNDGVRVAVLSPLEAVAIGLMDGKRSDGVVEEVMLEVADRDGVVALQQVKKRLGPLLTTGGRTPQAVSLHRLASVRPPGRSGGIRPLPGPRVLHWSVTDVCPRRCVYCYADPKHGNCADDATLTRERLNDIFAESALIGTTGLLVAGGEPFLRPDLPEVLSDAIRHGITPGITTKFPIDADLSKRLADGGLSHICLSVDSFSPEDNETLMGSRGYAAQVRTSMHHLKRSGVAFSLECVLTKINLHALESVIAEGERLGARVVQVVPYEPVLRPIGPYQNENLMLPQDDRLDDKLHNLRLKYPNIEIERFKKTGGGSRSKSYCDIGMTKLFFASDGKVHRCYKLQNDHTLSGADLNHVSVAEAWHDPRFAMLIAPPRSAYFDSACARCVEFYSCHDKGRCIYQSYVDHQNYFFPDRICDGPYTNGH